MSHHDFNTTIIVDQSPEDVFNAVTNVRGWWSEEIEGGTEKLNDQFDYHYKDVHRCTMMLTEVIPNEKVVWHCVDNYFSFTKDETEWKDTHIVFDIAPDGGKTKLRVTHVGLVPEYECYNICENAWTNYIQNSLHSLITTGKGFPNNSETPRTEDEERLGG